MSTRQRPPFLGFDGTAGRMLAGPGSGMVDPQRDLEWAPGLKPVQTNPPPAFIRTRLAIPPTAKDCLRLQRRIVAREIELLQRMESRVIVSLEYSNRRRYMAWEEQPPADRRGYDA